MKLIQACQEYHDHALTARQFFDWIAGHLWTNGNRGIVLKLFTLCGGA